MEQEKIVLNRKELKRYKVISHLIQGYITGGEAAELLSLSTRQVYRLKKRVLEEGETGVIHKNRGRKPAHALSKEKRQHIKTVTIITLQNFLKSIKGLRLVLLLCVEFVKKLILSLNENVDRLTFIDRENVAHRQEC